MNKIFMNFYQKKLFTLNEANKIIRNYQVCKNNIQRLVNKRQIITLKSGLYYVVPLDYKDFYPDPIHIASKLRMNGVICANSALFVHKLTSNMPDTIYIGHDNPTKLRIHNYTYRIIKNFNFGIDKAQYDAKYGVFELKVTDIERTIIDCLRTRSVTCETMIQLLRSKVPIINQKKILKYLEKYDMPILYNKTGLVLEACKLQLKIDNDTLEKIQKKLTKKIYYFKEHSLKLTRTKYLYDKRWNIMLPENLHTFVNINRQI